MTVSIDELRTIPLFRRITDVHMKELVEAFEKIELQPGDNLFQAGEPPTHFYLLVDGEIILRDGSDIQFYLHPPAPIGELGAVSGYARNTTAEATQASSVWRIERKHLIDFFEEHGDVAFPFYHNLMGVVAEKISRDSRRMEEMRKNLITTQKGMKRLRDLVLESVETPVSAEIHDTLDALIAQNRRSNYVVEPPGSIPAHVRLSNGADVEIQELSAVWLVLPRVEGVESDDTGHWSGVLVTQQLEIPLSGTANFEANVVRIELDLLIDDFAEQLDDYLTRVQMLDVVV